MTGNDRENEKSDHIIVELFRQREFLIDMEQLEAAEMVRKAIVIVAEVNESETSLSVRDLLKENPDERVGQEDANIKRGEGQII